MAADYQKYLEIADKRNRSLAETAENMRLSILGKESLRKDEKPLEIVEEYVKENTFEIIDPLGVLQKIEESKLRRSSLLTELETQIKVSNATTFIEV